MRGLVLIASFLCVALGIVSTACGSGNCRTVTGDPRGASGSLTYRPGDGTTTYAATEASIWAAELTALTLNAQLASATTSDARTLSLEIRELEVGKVRSFAGDEHAAIACISSPFDYASGRTSTKTCMPFLGTVEVKKLDLDCYRHESGVGTCAENIDVTIRGKATSGTTTLDIELTVKSAQHWTDTKCGPD